MSPSSPPKTGKAKKPTGAARAKMLEERRRQALRERRRRQVTIFGGAGVLVLVLVVVGGLVAYNINKSGKVTFPEAAGTGYSLPVGQPAAPVTLDAYEDFRCPACGQFEQTFGDTVKGLVADGSMKINYHMMSFLDDNLGGNSSKRSANASACAANQGKFKEFHDQVYANQPKEEKDDSYTVDALTGFGQAAGVTDQAAFATCVQDEPYSAWVKKVDDQSSKAGVTGTPTFFVNGKKLDTAGLTPETFTATIKQASGA